MAWLAAYQPRASFHLHHSVITLPPTHHQPLICNHRYWLLPSPSATPTSGGSGGARRNGGRGGGGGRGGQGRSGDALVGQHLLAAAALGVAVWQLASSPATRPALASITSPGGLPRLAGSKPSGPAASSRASDQDAQQRLRPRSRVMFLRCDGGATLVVPLTGAAAAAQQQLGGGAASGGDSQRGARVVDSPLQLSEAEHRMLADRQYRVKEVLRV